MQKMMINDSTRIVDTGDVIIAETLLNDSWGEEEEEEERLGADIRIFVARQRLWNDHWATRLKRPVQFMQITVTFSATGEASLCRIITATATEEAISACSPSPDTSGDIPLGRKNQPLPLIAYACRISAR